jgi:CHAT domain-containing protein
VLTSARLEIANIAAIYSPVFVKVGEAATVDAFRGFAGRATVVHFAGHVLLNERYPMLSRLIFALADKGDSMLLAGDLASLTLSRVRLVVLAACRTGEGTTSRSAGVNSVARPLLRAGVPAVVGTLWEIEDAGSPGIMTEFHRRFRHGEGVVESLRQAQLKALGAAGRSSWEWAAFSVFGGI